MAVGGGYFPPHPLQFGNYGHVKEKWPHRTVAEKLLQAFDACLLVAESEGGLLGIRTITQ